jgi:hypothetical protein
LTLGRCISRCRREGVLEGAEDVSPVQDALFINELRNDVIHARLEAEAPRAPQYRNPGNDDVIELIQDTRDNIIMTEDGPALVGEGEELSLSLDTGQLHRVYPYRQAAKDALQATDRLIGYLCEAYWEDTGGT